MNLILSFILNLKSEHVSDSWWEIKVTVIAKGIKDQKLGNVGSIVVSNSTRRK